jgi:hypothetical protein
MNIWVNSGWICPFFSLRKEFFNKNEKKSKKSVDFVEKIRYTIKQFSARK